MNAPNNPEKLRAEIVKSYDELSPRLQQVAKYVLDNNSYRGEPIFTSLIVTHTGDDCAVTGIMAESVDMSVVDELMWDALQEGAHKAAELGLYGPGQDLVADAFTGNLRGAGPATVALPFPVRKDNPSQTVLVSYADKTEPMAFNHFATGAYMLPRFNTGLVIVSGEISRTRARRSIPFISGIFTSEMIRS